jgi:hypothetical protein
VLRTSGADAGGLENKDGKYNDKDSEIGGAGGVLRAFGADADGLENKDENDRDDDSENGGQASSPSTSKKELTPLWHRLCHYLHPQGLRLGRRRRAM